MSQLYIVEVSPSPITNSERSTATLLHINIPLGVALTNVSKISLSWNVMKLTYLVVIGITRINTKFEDKI